MSRSRHVERVLAYADRDERGCLVSRYSAGSHGYAQAWDGERNVLAHRMVWEAANGPIPEGMTVDHFDHCNRKCIEVGHMRLLTNAENGRRNRPGLDYPLDWTCPQNHGVDRNAQGKCPECVREHKRRNNAKPETAARKNEWARRKRQAA